MNRERVKWLAFVAISAGLGFAALRSWWPRSWRTVLAGAAGHEVDLSALDVPDQVYDVLGAMPVWATAWQDKPWPENPFPAADQTGGAVRVEEKSDPQLSEPSYVLQAVLWGRNPVALLNGRLVTVGSRLPDGSTVEQINAEMVVLARNGGRVEIPLSRSGQAERQERSP